MSGIYDNWEKLVGAVLKREELRRLALCESFSSSSISADFSSHFSFGSALEDVPPVGNNNLTPDEAQSYAIMQLPEQKSKHTGFAFDSPGYESFLASQAESFSSSSISANFISRFCFGSAPEDVPPVGNNNLTPDEARSYAVKQLPRQKSKHTGFAFDSPGYESFFASQAGVYVPKKAWDVARRDSMRSLPKTLRKN